MVFDLPAVADRAKARLTGRGLDKRIQSAIDLQCIVAREPLTAVARGTGKILDNIDEYEQVIMRGSER